MRIGKWYAYMLGNRIFVWFRYCRGFYYRRGYGRRIGTPLLYIRIGRF